MTHPLSLPGRIRYLPSFAVLPGSYSPPSWFKQRAIDVFIIGSILFPAYRRHQMRKKPLYKFLDVNTGEVVYFDDLKDYKNAIYNRVPEKLPNLRGYFFRRYEFDFRDRVYSNYQSYEPYFLRMRNWLTFNNHRSRVRTHFSHRMKDNKFAVGTRKRMRNHQRTKKANKKKHKSFWGRIGPAYNNRPRSIKRDVGLGQKAYEEPNLGTLKHREATRPQLPNPQTQRRKKFSTFHDMETTNRRVMGTIGLDYQRTGPRTVTTNENLDSILTANPDYYRRVANDHQYTERIEGDRGSFMRAR